MKEDDKDKTIAALQAEIDTMKSIISMMPGHVYWKDVNGKYLGCNNNVSHLLKLKSADEIIGKSDEDLIGVELAKKTTEIDNLVLSSKQENRMEEVGFDADGNPAIYLTQKSPLYSRTGNLKGVLGISLDISARKHMEDKLRIAKRKAEAANRAKSQFLAMVSHELRTPLTSILGFVSFLEQEDISEHDKKQYIQYIINSGSYLFSLINNLLDYNKLETNNYELNKTSLNLKKLMEDVISMLSGAAKLKDISLTLDYDTTAPEYLITDGSVLKQILINLIGNAVKFTEKGYVTLRTKVLALSSESTDLLIEIEDSGPGIPSDEQRSIFKRFYQSGNVYTRNSSLMGTGLGLAIVKKLATLLSSRIRVHSIVNEGSTFYFSVHFQNVSIEEKKQLENIKPFCEILSSSKPKTLLIEDDTLIQIVHKQMLEELGCQVNIAECGSKALFMLKQDYDILFVDIGLPDMGGFDLIKSIRQNYLTHQQIPIIALTGYSEETEKQQCLQAGADEVAVKPISKAALGALLKRYLKNT